MEIRGFWKAVLEQNEQEIRKYFHQDAYVNWHCTREHFTVNEFITANCEYPGEWAGEIERIEKTEDGIVTVTHVYPKDKAASFHAVSFFKIKDSRIAALDEYWADDGPPPEWRVEKHIGTLI